METKICNICNINKKIEEYHKDKTKKDGHRNKCKECSKKYLANYYRSNQNKIKKLNMIWRENNKEKIIKNNNLWKENNPEKFKEAQLKYRIINKEKIQKRTNNYNNLRRSIDPIYKLRCYLSRTFSMMLREKGFKKTSSTHEILDCSYEEFRIYLESKFEDWMTWENYGKPKDGILEPNKTWDMDHIIPTSKAITENDIIRLNHYTNIQPLCSFYNQRIKRNLF